MKKTIGRILIVIVALAIVFSIISTLISDTDWYQQKTQPKQFWRKKVQTLEEVIKFDMVMIRDAEIELKKTQITAPLEFAQTINLAKATDVNEKKWRELAEQNTKSELEAAKGVLKLWKQQLLEDQNKLEKSKTELAKYE